jgi:arginyl-tRNA synthetase
VKSDGATLYATRDLSAAQYRHKQYSFDRMIYVHGVEQKLHFRQFFKVLELIGMEWAGQLLHVDFGHYRFKEGKMSTRAGKFILLEDVLNQAIERAQKIVEEKNPNLKDKEEVCRAVGIGAILFADMSSRRRHDVEFDWDRILTFDGETGPYLQYAHVRVCGIERKWGRPIGHGKALELLTEQEEYLLAKKLADFPSVLQRATEQCEPSNISTYLLEVAKQFNNFYHHHTVIQEDQPELTEARLTLVTAVRQVLANGLRLLGIAPLTQM